MLHMFIFVVILDKGGPYVLSWVWCKFLCLFHFTLVLNNIYLVIFFFFLASLSYGLHLLYYCFHDFNFILCFHSTYGGILLSKVCVRISKFHHLHHFSSHFYKIRLEWLVTFMTSFYFNSFYLYYLSLFMHLEFNTLIMLHFHF